MFTGLPLVLHEGSIGSVTARVPFPNPLTGNVNLSLQSLRLTFHLVPETPDLPTTIVDLADSVASIAHTFLHDELSVDEEEI